MGPRPHPPQVLQVIRATAEVPGTVGWRQEMGRKHRAMIDQVEAETMGVINVLGEADHNAGDGHVPAGQIPAFFVTRNCNINGSAQQRRWCRKLKGESLLPVGEVDEQVRRKRMRDEQIELPLAVAYYNAMRLEVGMRLEMRLVPGSPDAPGVRDYYGAVEWNKSGVTHLHATKWTPGSVRVEDLCESREDVGRMAGADPAEVVDAVVRLYEPHLTEYHPAHRSEPAFDKVGDKKTIQEKAARGDTDAEQVRDPCSVELEEYLQYLDPANTDARDEFMLRLVEWTQYHDNHSGSAGAMGPPTKADPCARITPATVGTDHEIVECKRRFPRDLVPPGHEFIKQDPSKPSLILLHLARNTALLNNFCPIALFWYLANLDDQACLVVDAIVNYTSKYMAGAKGEHPGGASGEMSDMYEAALNAARDQGKGIHPCDEGAATRRRRPRDGAGGGDARGPMGRSIGSVDDLKPKRRRRDLFGNGPHNVASP